jgi:hypothetical protein
MIVSAAVIALVGGLMWLSDFITPEGQWTVYTVDCEGGVWKGNICTGQLSAGPLYQFIALPLSGQVVYWSDGTADRPGTLSHCTVESNRTWRCPAAGPVVRTITTRLEHGRAMHDRSGKAREFHSVPKWRWLLLSAGVRMGRSAE